MRRIVLACSGGFEASLAIPWLAETQPAEVVTVTVDLGQGRDLADVRESALALGAVRAHVVDARQAFVREYVIPALQAGSPAGQPPRPDALGRAIIARTVIDVARMESASAVAHVSTGAAGDSNPFEVALRSLAPAVEVVRPSAEWSLEGLDAISYARARGVPAVSAVGPFRTEANLWGRTSSSRLGFTHAPIDEGAYTLTRPAAAGPDLSATLDITFESGVPVAVNGIEMPLLELIESVETISGSHGVGRMTLPAEGLWIEAPAAMVLSEAHRALERIVLPRELASLRSQAASTYAALVREGRWFSPGRQAIDALVAALQPLVRGAVRLELLKGECRVLDAVPTGDGHSGTGAMPGAVPQVA